MATHYERLSFLDTTFLVIEGPRSPMHVGATLVFTAGETLRAQGGGVDIDAFRTFIGNRLHHAPRYRQRLEWVPIERHPVWVDDEHFDLSHHVRHVALPHPGTPEQMREMSGRFLSQQLDRARPLWEVLVIEGLADGGFAVVTKVHHCMIDGIGGVDLLKVLLSPFPSDDLGEPVPFEPRPAPERIDLFLEEAVRRIQYPADALRNFRRFREETREIGQEVRHRLLAMTNTARSGWFVNASETPLNTRIGPNRRVAHLVTDLDKVKAIKKGLGGTVNDAVIAAVAGAVRSFLREDREFDVTGVDFRAMVPVSTRDESGDSGLGNHITMWLVDLPIAEPDPVERYRAIGRATEHRKQTDQALGAAMLTQSASFTPSTVLGVAARLAAATARPFNMTVTNVPGPQVSLYLLESQLLRIFPMVPLWVNHGLGVALFSYDGMLNWGFAADWDTVPDLDAFVLRLDDAIEELFVAAT